MTSAAETLRSVAFNKNGDQYESRNKRRNDTVELIEKAIAKLNRGESVPKLIEEASDLNRGYSNRNRMLPQVRRSIDEAGEHLTKALSHLSEK